MADGNRLTAFICSTGIGLPEVRDAVRDGCLAAGVLPLMIESSFAAGGAAHDTTVLDRADLFILILGWRYGHMPAGSRYSVPELEYRRAIAKKIPVLAFFPDPSFAVPVTQVEQDVRSLARLDRFRSAVRAGHSVGVFRSIDELKAQVAVALRSLRMKLAAAEAPRAEVRTAPGGARQVIVAEKTTTGRGMTTAVGSRGARNKSARSPASIAEAPARKRPARPSLGRPSRVFRVFVASPKDVQAERDRLPRVVSMLNQTLGSVRPVVVELWRFEVNAPPNVGEPQNLIDPELDKADVVVVILWNRLGLKTPKGTTGTESEVLRSLKRWRKTGRPDVMIYFCTRPSNLNRPELEQRMMLLDFKDKLDGLALTKEFETSDDFERVVYGDAFTILARLSADA